MQAATNSREHDEQDVYFTESVIETSLSEIPKMHIQKAEIDKV